MVWIWLFARPPVSAEVRGQARAPHPRPSRQLLTDNCGPARLNVGLNPARKRPQHPSAYAAGHTRQLQSREWRWRTWVGRREEGQEGPVANRGAVRKREAFTDYQPCWLTLPVLPEGSRILNAIAAKLKNRSKDDFKGRHFEAALIVQAVSWYLRYPLSYRDIEKTLL